MFARLQSRREYHMKSLIVVAAVAVLTVGNAIAAMPGTAQAAGKPVAMMSQQELPFDSYWSKN
jgi:hypothetical protein